MQQVMSPRGRLPGVRRASVVIALGVVLMGAALGCGHGPSAGSGEGPGAGAGAAGDDAGSSGSAASGAGQDGQGGQSGAAEPAPARTGPPDERECRALSDHVVAVGMARFKGADPETVPTEEQLQKIRDELAREFLPRCLAIDRLTYECVMRAGTQDDIARCSAPAAPADDPGR